MKKILFLLPIVFIACQKEIKQENYDIDLSIKTNKAIKSYKIDSEGNVIFLNNQVNEVGRVYKCILSKNEKDSIQTQISQIHPAVCDSITDLIGDLPSYTLIVDSGKKKQTYQGIACKNYKNIDDLVFYIVKVISKKKQNEFFESIILPTPSIETHQ